MSKLQKIAHFIKGDESWTQYIVSITLILLSMQLVESIWWKLAVGLAVGFVMQMIIESYNK